MISRPGIVGTRIVCARAPPLLAPASVASRDHSGLGSAPVRPVSETRDIHRTGAQARDRRGRPDRGRCIRERLRCRANARPRRGVEGRSLYAPASLSMSANAAPPVRRVVGEPREQLAELSGGSDDLLRALDCGARAHGVERQGEMQDFTSVGVDARHQSRVQLVEQVLVDARFAWRTSGIPLRGRRC